MASVIISIIVAALVASIFERANKGSSNDIRPKYQGVPIELRRSSEIRIEPPVEQPIEAVDSDSENRVDSLSAFSDTTIDEEGAQGDEGVGSPDEIQDSDIVTPQTVNKDLSDLQQRKNKSLIDRLVDPDTIRAAIILNEVVGRPRALKPWTSR